MDTALAHGALGARMTGGGFGGSAVILTDTAEVPSLTESLEAAFTAARFTTPRVFEAVPSAGARRLV